MADSEVYSARGACLKGVKSLLRVAPEAAGPDAAGENPRYEVFEDRAGLWRFRLRSRNGKIIAASGTYASRRGAVQGTEALRRAAARLGQEPLVILPVESGK